MKLSDLKRHGVRVMHFEKKGFFDERDKQFYLYRDGDPSYCSIYQLRDTFYYVQRINILDVRECNSYGQALNLFRSFVTLD